MRVYFLPIFILSFISCSEDIGYKLSFKVNSCIKEIHKQYRDQSRAPSSIYKLLEVDKLDKGPQLKVSVWHNYSWYYQGIKRYNYFKDTNLFAYERTPCPDKSDGPSSISDRIDMKL